jgi:hypothetical protein
MGRYVVAAIVAVGLTLAGFFFVRAMRAYAASLGGPDMNVELPSFMIWLVFLSDLMITFWWITVPLLFILCFGVASLFGPAGKSPNP